MDSNNQIKEFNTILEEDDDSFDIKLNPHRNRSHGKLIYSKITKKIKKNFSPKLFLSLNTYNSISTPRLQNVPSKQKASISDYELLSYLGNGSYGKVILAKSKFEEKKYAIKEIKKALLDRFGKQYEIHIEKYCLVNLSHPNIIKFSKAFQDKKHLFFVLEYCKNKDLGKLIQKMGTFNFKLAQYYAAEIISAISYMKKFNIYHRDLKPENIGVDEDMHLKILDFATANIEGKYFDKTTMKFVTIPKKEYEDAVLKKKQNENKDIEDYVLISGNKIMNLVEKFVGTPEYIAPEVLEKKYDLIGPSVDIWALGVMIYLFFVGKTPFKGKTEEETLNNIRNVNYSFDIESKHEKKNINIPEEAKDLIQKILIKDPTKRIGYGSKDYKEIKDHPFFKGINFDNLFEEPIPLIKVYSLLESFGYIENKNEIKEKDDDIYINVLNKNDNNELFDDKNSVGSADNADISINYKNVFRNSLSLLKYNLSKSVSSSLNIYDLKDNNIIDNKFGTPQNKIKIHDEVLIEDILYKKSLWLHYNKRYVKLFSKGHLNCYDYNSRLLKESILINENTFVFAQDDYRFVILTQNKYYYFKHITKRIADKWVDNIKNIIFEQKRSLRYKNC